MTPELLDHAQLCALWLGVFTLATTLLYLWQHDGHALIMQWVIMLAFIGGGWFVFFHYGVGLLR